MIFISLVVFVKIADYIQIIYADYGERFYTVCFIPFITTILNDLIISANINLFVLSLIAYSLGPLYLNVDTGSLSQKIFQIVVPLKIREYHKIIVRFQGFYKAYRG